MSEPLNIYISLWTLENGKRLPTLTNKASFDRFRNNPTDYKRKRLERWNHPRSGHRLSKATDFIILEYQKAF